VALARAIVVNPKVLLLDEPLSNLDAHLREEMRFEIRRLHDEFAMTMVYVTHDQGEAMALGDRIAVMSHGRVEQIGTPQDIYHRPASAFVADFIGTMNRVTGTRDDGVLRLPGGALVLPAHANASEHALFRPEDVRIVEPATAALRGTVDSAFFLGNMTRVVVDLGDAQSVVVDTLLRRTFAKGEAVGLDVDPSSILVLGEAD
jgi:putative spermidine/putrescine transport system ATP-binding protein